MLLACVVSSGPEVKLEVGIKKIQKGWGKGQDTGFEVRLSVHFLFLVVFLLFCLHARARGWGWGFERECNSEVESEGYNQSQPRFARGLLWEVRFTISPLQRIDGHMHPIKTIDIGRHEQRVMYAYISTGFARLFVCVVINEQRANRQSTHKKRTSYIIVDTI